MQTNTVLPALDVALGAWTASGASSAAVALQVNDGDTSYIATRTNAIATLRFQASGIPSDGTIISVSLSAYIRNLADGAEAATCSLRVKLGATNYIVASDDTFTTSYVLLSGTLTTNPATGQAWKPVEVGNLQGVIQVTQGIGLPRMTVRATQFFADIACIAPTFKWPGIMARV